MVSPKTLTTIGQAFAYLIIVTGTIQFSKAVPQLAKGPRSDVLVGLIGMGFNLAWICMTFGCIMSIKKKNLQFAKIYYIFFIVCNVVGIILYIISLHIEDDSHVHLDGVSTSVWVTTLIVAVLALAMLPLGIWILNGVIRYIETEKEAQQMVA
ncbi:hypothetical protein quinque_015803 [Culex quinquefasciatus]